MKTESVILDIDGTLWDSRALVAEGWNIQLRHEGLEHLTVSAQQLQSLFGMTLEPLADALFGSVPAPERYRLMARCMETEQDHLRRDPCRIGYPGVKETLEQLRKTHRLFLVSNSEKGYPQLCVEKLGLEDLICGHLCYGDTGTSKGQTIRILMEAYGISSAVYVGDTQSDRDACLEAGIPFIYAAYGFGAPDGCDAKIDSIRDLPRLLEDDGTNLSPKP